MSQALLYVRVSSVQQEEGFSLDAQEKLGHDYALRHTLKIVKSWKVSESAWKDDRVAFNQLVEYAKRHKEIKDIIFDVTDRATRNDFDKLKIWSLVKEFGKTIHFARSNKILNHESGSDDEFMLDIEVAVAKKMSNDISRKAKMGMQEKAEQGLYPSTAPTGYKNNPVTGLIDIEQDKAPHIKRMFELMSTGNYSCEMLSELLYKEGFRNKRGTRSHKSAIAHYLRNPIYYGAFRWKGLLMQGSHTPIISKELFDKVQDVISGKSKVHIHRKGFAFNNLIFCGECGCKVVGELQKGHHYYHCTFSKGRHEGKGRYLRGEKISDLVSDRVREVTLDRQTIDWVKENLRVRSKAAIELQEKRLAALKTQHETVSNRMSRLYDAKFDGTITEEVFTAKEKEYQGQLLEIKANMEGMQTTNPNYYDDGCQILELSNRLHSLYVAATYEEKGQIANILASNFTLVDVSLVPKWRKPFSFFAEGLSRSRWLPEAHARASVFRGRVPDFPL
ncbi:MAG: recombinase family protein [Candidatus Omnitrophota bacterium]